MPHFETSLPLCAVLLLWTACAGPAPRDSSQEVLAEAPGPPAVEDWFVDVRQEAGLDFVHVHGGSGERYMVETMGSGGGLFDFDGDGRLDIYLVQGGPLPGFADPAPLPNRLYRNVTAAVSELRFEDVTGSVGGGDTGYGMGVCFGDVDNDGFPDVYVTNYGPDRLYRNERAVEGRRLRDVTEKAGIHNPRWGMGCAFADYDRDGCLDLYVVNYVDFELASHRRCTEDGLHVYCHPDVYRGALDVLYRNRCDGTGSFEDVTEAAGVLQDDPAEAKGLGVVWTDIDDDGDADLYVANDSTRNFLFRNEGRDDGGTVRFREVGVASGTAFNLQGLTEAGMGVDAGDVDGDGRFDLFVAHLDFETNTLYRNQGRGLFVDATAQAGLAAPSMRRVGFGVNLFDADNDGDLDLFVANGHILDNIAEQKPSVSFAQPDQLFVNDGTGRFAPAENAGEYFARAGVSRASVAGDLDNDGDLDLLITHCDGPPAVLENRRGEGAHGLVLRLASRFGGRDAFGARVRLVTPSGSQVEELRSGSSYLSQGDPRVHFGLGTADRPTALEVRWPEGGLQTFDTSRLAIDAVNILRQEDP